MGETTPNRRRLSPRNPSTSVRMEHCIPRPDQRSEPAASHHPVGLAIAIHEHGGAEPLAIEPPANRDPIEFKILVVGAFVGTETYGDLVLPASHREGQRHPLIVVTYESRGFLRGGTGDEYPIHVLADRGYAVLSLHRPIDIGFTAGGKTAREVEATNLKDWADRRNVQSALENGVKLLEARGIVDADHMAIAGFSEGSVIAAWAVFNSNLFAAAAVGTGPMGPDILALQDASTARFFRDIGYPGLWEEADDFWKRLSFEYNAADLKTPTLMQVPESESLLAMRAINIARERGRPLELYVFPNEYHYKWQPGHRAAVYRRNLQWFDFWLMGREDSSPIDPDQYSRWNAMKAAMASK